MLDVSEDGHADDSVDEGDEGEEGADVEESRQGHDQGEQQLPDTLRGLGQNKISCRTDISHNETHSHPS